MYFTRITAIAGAMILLLVIPGVSRAQRAQVVGVTRRAAPIFMPQALRVTPTGAVGGDTTQATQSGTPHWVGATIGAALGGVLGYKWYGGLCEGENRCSGRPGAVGGVVIGGIIGYLLGDVFEH
ncbi:MAG TPA: hypothetical protein VIC03_11380 [Gemmatimonadaceae bacterium]|jgi:hypothetical protein